MIGVGRLLGIAVVLLLAGCTTTTPGTPAAPTATATPAPAQPPRPRDILLDDVDPCTLLTEAQRAELGLDRPPRFDRSPSLLYPGEESSCTIRRTEPAAFTNVGVVTTVGIEFFTAGNLAGDFRPVQVAGFPAIRAVPEHVTDFCTVVVDVAPGQLLDVQFADGGGTPPLPQDQLCDDALRTAELVVTTLLATR